MKDNNEISFDSESIKAYLGGKLSQEQTIKFEKLIADNPFYKDALEGLKSNMDSFESLESLKNKSREFYSLDPSVLYSFFLIAFFLLGGLFLFNLQKTEKKDLPIVNLNNVENLKEKKEPKIEFSDESIVELTDLNIEKSVYKEVDKQVKVQKLVNDNKLKANVETELEQKKLFIKNEKIEQKPMLLIPVKENDIVTEKVPLISMHGLINVNYSKIGTGVTVKKRSVNFSGVPANKENNMSNSNEPSHEKVIQEIPYDVYLSEIQLLFSLNKFKKALKGYKEVLKQHPGDLNAHFYSGLCYYNINQSKKALEHFSKVELHKYDTFREEGEWYKAQVLYDLKKVEESSRILEKIILNNGFYKRQAELELIRRGK